MNGLEKLCSMVTNRFGKSRKQKQSSNNKYVVYYRVSTKQQGQSGLGLDAQKAAAEAYVREHGGETVRQRATRKVSRTRRDVFSPECQLTAREET